MTDQNVSEEENSLTEANPNEISIRFEKLFAEYVAAATENRVWPSYETVVLNDVEPLTPITTVAELQASLPQPPAIEIVEAPVQEEEVSEEELAHTTEELLDEVVNTEYEGVVTESNPVVVPSETVEAAVQEVFDEFVEEDAPAIDHSPVSFDDDESIVIGDGTKDFSEFAAEQVNEHNLDEFIADYDDEVELDVEPVHIEDDESADEFEQTDDVEAFDEEDDVIDPELFEQPVQMAPTERVIEREIIREVVIMDGDQARESGYIRDAIPAENVEQVIQPVILPPVRPTNFELDDTAETAPAAVEDFDAIPEPAVDPQKAADAAVNDARIKAAATKKAKDAFKEEQAASKRKPVRPAKEKEAKPARRGLFGRKKEEPAVKAPVAPVEAVTTVEPKVVEPLRVRTDDYVAREKEAEKPPVDDRKGNGGLFGKKKKDAVIDDDGVNPQEWLETTIHEALKQNASDLHIAVNGETHNLTARIRVDGVMMDFDEVHGVNARIIMGRLKAATKLSSAGSFEPEETIYEIELNGEKRKARAVIFRTHDGGEALVMRLPLGGELQHLDELNFSEKNLELFYELLASPSKLIMIAGPMGSGKTTTAHGAMLHVSTDERTVWTIEDPVERTLPGTVQLEIDEENGATFDVLLSKLLRADYNTLFLGEIRDHGTAAAGVRQAKAGRQVMSTIHANNNVTALLRLIELAQDSPLSVLDSVRGVVSQRLIRKLNPDWDGVDPRTKYSGRTPIHEVLFIDDNLIEVMMQNRPLTEIKKAAAGAEGSSFAEDCQRLLDAGLTDEEEIRRVIGDLR